MNVFVKLANGARLPEKDKLDAGWDLWSIDPVVSIKPGCIGRIGTGVYVDMSAAWSPTKPVCALLKTRSSYAAKGLVVVGGVIDPSYRGEIIVLMLNTTGQSVHIEAGEKVAQMLFLHQVPVEMQKSGTISDSERGDKGFGSTGQPPPVEAAVDSSSTRQTDISPPEPEGQDVAESAPEEAQSDDEGEAEA